MSEITAHYLYAGALFANKSPHVITTILGSCVAVCLWDPILHIGGINHYQLDLWNGCGLASPKYGNIAIQKLIEKMLRLGSEQSSLKAKVFGGAAVIGNHCNSFNIGGRNSDIALKMLHDADIPVIAKNIGGYQGRKLIFFTQTGVVMMKKVQKNSRAVQS